jgi:hypothetical protein
MGGSCLLAFGAVRAGHAFIGAAAPFIVGWDAFSFGGLGFLGLRASLLPLR